MTLQQPCALACLLVAVAALPGLAPGFSQPAHRATVTLARSDAGGECSIAEISRQNLIVGGNRQLYVQPLVLERNSKGDVLVAGELHHLFERSGTGNWVRVASDSIFGAVVSRSGATRIVPSPISSKALAGIRAVAREDGSWTVVFGENAPSLENARPDTITRLWIGVFDGVRWVSVQRMPLPPGRAVRTRFMSPLVQYGDTLAIAMRVRSPDGRRDAVIFERRGHQWSHEIVPTRAGAYLDLAHSDAAGLVLATVQPDFTLKGGDGNSLFLWTRRGGWEILRKAVPSSTGEVHRPALSLSSAGEVLGWAAEVPGRSGGRLEARGMIGRSASRQGPILSLDSSIAAFSEVRPFAVRGGYPIWVLDHVFQNGTGREIRFVRGADETVTVIGRLPNPFAAGFAVTSADDTTLHIAGGVVDRARTAVVSVLIRVRVHCSTGATR